MLGGPPDTAHDPNFNPFSAAGPSSPPTGVWFSDTESFSDQQPDSDTEDIEVHTRRQTRSGHNRYQTEILLSSSSSSHPLRSAGLGSVPISAGITRPHLAKRVKVSSADSDSAAGSASEGGQVETDTAHERVVLVHEVTSSDSLAGVALKYGISLADLRRANQLWASDSIHLRKVLYIPLNKTSHLHTLPVSADPSASEGQPSGSEQHIPQVNSHPYATIRRIPASQMSFFPPPSKLRRTNSDSRSTPRMSVRRPKILPHERHSTSSSPSFSSMIASTRDSLMARLSLDSASSNEGRPGDNHELDDVNNRRSSEDGTSWAQTPKARYHTPLTLRGAKLNGYESASEHVQMNGVSSRGSGHRRTRSHVPHTEGFGGRSQVQQIRTVQLQPSAEMILPVAQTERMDVSGRSSSNVKHTNGAVKRRGRLSDVEFSLGRLDDRS